MNADVTMSPLKH